MKKINNFVEAETKKKKRDSSVKKNLKSQQEIFL